MIHALFFLLYALVAAVAFAAFTNGDGSNKIRHGIKVFAEFVGVGLALGWICYFLPW